MLIKHTKCITINVYPCSKQLKSQEPFETEGDVDEFEDNENNSLWMTSTQFSQLLDKQEVLENLGYTQVNKKKKSKQEVKVIDIENLCKCYRIFLCDSWNSIDIQGGQYLSEPF